MKLMDKIKSKSAKICVIGIGYMGLPISALFAKQGFDVLGFDVDAKKVELVNKSIPPFEEKDLPELIKSVRFKSKLRASSKIEKADIFLISVPTPKKNNNADLSFVEAATKSIYSVLEEGNLVILESTVPPKTSINLIKPLLDQKKIKYYLAHCPERAFPGNTIYELINNDRIVGGLDEEATSLAKELYLTFVKGKIFTTTITTAEFCKLAENTYRDVNIALANELALLCEDVGINVWDLIELANKHPRVNILQPGPGVGGHCIPKDPIYLYKSSTKAKLIPIAREVNDSMPKHVVDMIKEEVKGVKKPKIALLGASFKKNVDDTRDSPTEFIAKLLLDLDYEVKIHDPLVKMFKFELSDYDACVKDADLVVLLIDHDYYKSKDFSKLKILDTRNFYPKAARKLGVGSKP
ncbi:UDP-N-acetyl-D-mannosamine dehydrogenase [Candidatus Tiddalikarchaeum anstoanum]|nr:UDP-N-acetyl-D-mannosamine dehydrogenase [Candidatus Tiddalikarchaeum anstoanum]